MKAKQNWALRLFHYVKNLYVQKCLSKYHVSIRTLPMWNWISFSEKGEVKYLLNKGTRIDFAGQIAYQKIQDDMIDTLGISDEYMNVLETKIKIEKMYAKLLNGDRKQLLLIEIEEMELGKLESKGTTKTDLQESLFQIEKIQGVRYNPKEITVYDFYKLAKLVSKK